MPLPTIANCYRVAMSYVVSGHSSTATNVIHVVKASTDENGIFDAIDSSVTATMWGPSTDALAMADVTITQLDGTPDGLVFAGSSLAGDWPDGAGSQDFTPAACALIKIKTGSTGRSGRGRVYLPFVAEGNATAGSLTSTLIANTTGAWSTFASTLNTDHGVEFGVASYTNAYFSPYQSVQCETALATQRKRQRR